MDDPRVLHLFRAEIACRVLREQLRQDQQAVQRGTQFVAHVRQELRLVLRGERELLRARLEFLACLLDLEVLLLDVAVLRRQQRRLLLQLGVGTLQFLLPRL